MKRGNVWMLRFLIITLLLISGLVVPSPAFSAAELTQAVTTVPSGGLPQQGEGNRLPALTLVADAAGNPIVSLVNGRGRLEWRESTFVFVVDGQLSIRLPGAPESLLDVNLEMGVDPRGGFAPTTIRGTANGSINVAGLRLGLDKFEVDPSGLRIKTATLELPAELGHGQVSVRDVRISDQGLGLGSAGLTFQLPEIRLAGSQVILSPSVAELGADEKGYYVAFTTTLNANLPGNPQQAPVAAELRMIDGQATLSGEVGPMTLEVAGLDLVMGGISLSNEGLYVPQAEIRLPVGTGNAVAVVKDVTFGAEGLQFGEAKLGFEQLLVASGLEVSNLKVGLEQDAQGGHALVFESDLSVATPGATEPVRVVVRLVQDATGRVSLEQGSISDIIITLPGEMTLSLTDNKLTLSGLTVGRASLMSPPSMGVQLFAENVTLSPAGLQATGVGAQWEGLGPEPFLYIRARPK